MRQVEKPCGLRSILPGRAVGAGCWSKHTLKWGGVAQNGSSEIGQSIDIALYKVIPQNWLTSFYLAMTPVSSYLQTWGDRIYWSGPNACPSPFSVLAILSWEALSALDSTDRNMQTRQTDFSSCEHVFTWHIIYEATTRYSGSGEEDRHSPRLFRANGLELHDLICGH